MDLGAEGRRRRGPRCLRRHAAEADSGGRWPKLIVEVEVSGRALLEPQAVVFWRILKELGRLLENVLLLGRCPTGTTSLGLAPFGSKRIVDPILDRFLATQWLFWRFCLRRRRVLRRNAFSPGAPPAEKSTLTFLFRSGRRLGGFALGGRRSRLMRRLTPRSSRAWSLKAVLERLAPVAGLCLIGVLLVVILLGARVAQFSRFLRLNRIIVDVGAGDRFLIGRLERLTPYRPECLAFQAVNLGGIPSVLSL
ncbi:MAG: hypothetical protein JO342_04040 [Solirubrobacterales bacterium]|nr:hypothetical protein [Solirubrobacterales bacterium]